MVRLRSAGHLMRALASTTSMALPAASASPIPLYWLAACPKDGVANGVAVIQPFAGSEGLEGKRDVATHFTFLIFFLNSECPFHIEEDCRK